MYTPGPFTALYRVSCAGRGSKPKISLKLNPGFTSGQKNPAVFTASSTSGFQSFPGSSNKGPEAIQSATTVSPATILS